MIRVGRIRRIAELGPQPHRVFICLRDVISLDAELIGDCAESEDLIIEGRPILIADLEVILRAHGNHVVCYIDLFYLLGVRCIKHIVLDR